MRADAGLYYMYASSIRSFPKDNILLQAKQQL